MADNRGNHAHYRTRYRDRHCVRQHNPFTRKGHDLYIDCLQFIRQRTADGHSICFDPGSTTGTGEPCCICTGSIVYTHSWPCSCTHTFSCTRSYTCSYSYSYSYTHS